MGPQELAETGPHFGEVGDERERLLPEPGFWVFLEAVGLVVLVVVVLEFELEEEEEEMGS